MKNSDENTTFSVVKCPHCVFAITFEGKQVNCGLDRIHRFKKEGAKVEEKDGFFEIDRFCTTGRDNNWRDYKNTKPNIDLIQEVLLEVQTKLDVVVYCPAQTTYSDIEEFLITFLARNSQLYPNKMIFVVQRLTDNENFREDEIRPSQLIPLLRLRLDPQNIQWAVEHVVNFKLRDYEKLDRGLNRAETPMVAFLEVGKVIPHSFIKKIDYCVNHLCKRFVAIKPLEGDWHGLVTLRKYANHFGGFGKLGILTKWQQQEDEENELRKEKGESPITLIRTWQNLLKDSEKEETNP